MSETTLGHFCWYDLMVPDPDAAPAFYGPVLGWTTTPFEGAGEPYEMWVAGETPIGGFVELPRDAVDDGAPPHWLAYIATPDLDATVARATELGGTVISRSDVPTVGSIAVLYDPQGVIFSAYQPTEPYTPAEGAPPLGHVSWHELYSDDGEAGWSFYSDLFGWEETGTMEMGAGTYRMYGKDGREMGGMMTRPDENVPAMWFYYFRVADIDAAVEAVAAHGGEVWNGPMEVPGGDRVAHCRDPQGTLFALHTTAGGDE